MTIAILIVTLLLCLTVHEAAHALVMRNLDAPINRAGLGMPFPPTLRIATRWGFDFTLSPWLVGAYVDTTDEGHEHLDGLPYRQRAWYLNVGIVANLLLGFAAVAAGQAVNGKLVSAAVFAGLAVGIWFARRVIAAYVLPAAAVFALAFLVFGMAASWSAGETGMGFAGMPALVPSDRSELLAFVGAISLALAVLNMLPLHGLDNGKVVGIVLARWLPGWAVRVYQYTGVALVFAMLVGSVVSDLWAAAGAL
jgi:membrane-associated protease RseP (regulator of RpoE activity)